jgi:hypothetical protein
MTSNHSNEALTEEKKGTFPKAIPYILGNEAPSDLAFMVCVLSYPLS